MKKLAIIGSGDLGQLVRHYFSESKSYEVVGFFDDFKKVGELVDNAPIIGGLADVKEVYKKGLFDQIFLAVGYNHMEFRARVFSELASTIEFATYIHPTSYVDSTCKVGKGVLVLPGCIFDRNVIIEDNVFMNVGCSVSHDSKVGMHSFFGPRVAISGFCRIGSGNFLGTGTILRDGISTVDYTRTGAGAVLCKSAEKKGTYIGVPAKLVV